MYRIHTLLAQIYTYALCWENHLNTFWLKVLKLANKQPLEIHWTSGQEEEEHRAAAGV